MKDVAIVYCRPCGYLRRATEAAAALEQELGITAALTPGTGGVFEVRVGADIVARRTAGHFPGPSDVVKAVAAAIGTG